jgi:PBP1b-binding outer membrane lipoprotein LpoB
MRYLFLITLTILINGCSNSKPPMVDGKNRVPVNNQPVSENKQHSINIF